MSQTIESEGKLASMIMEANKYARFVAICDPEGNGIEIFDLTLQDAAVLGNQDPGEHTITYHEALVDAQAGMGLYLEGKLKIEGDAVAAGRLPAFFESISVE